MRKWENQDRLLAAMISGCLMLSACGGGMSGYSPASSSNTTGSTGTAPSAANSGQAMVMLTDAQGDFLSYIVTLDSLQLLTANGTSVETITATTQVDFSQLVDLSEVLTAGQIPVADYVSAKLTIDYSNAQITADDGNGNPVALTPVDGNGNPITGTLIVSVQLDSTHHLQVQSGHLGQLALDFNLAVSNAVNLNAGTVSVSPTLVASVVPSATKPIRVRGGFDSANAAQDDFVLDVQPFHDAKSTGTGQVTVQVTSATTYLINGTSFVGDAGLTALAALPAGTITAALGSVPTNAGAQATLIATSVLAGSSLETASEDRLSGTVIARDQTTLTVRSATWIHKDGSIQFQPHDATVTVGASTTITEEGQMGAFTLQSISVGQHVEAAGSATQTSNGRVTLDATSGQVRLDVTPAWGTVTSLKSGSLTLNLQSIDGLPASAFNFAGTGASQASDATATAYIVDTGTLTQSGIVLNGLTRVLGFAAPFGLAPPDFTAETLIVPTAVTSELEVQYEHGGSASAFVGLTASSTALQLQLPTNNDNGNNNNNNGNNNNNNGNNNGNAGCNSSGPGNNCNGGGGGGGNGVNAASAPSDGDNNDTDGNDGQGFIQVGPTHLALGNVASPITIAPDQSSTNEIFTIGHQGPLRNETYSSFSDFVVALAADIGTSTRVHAVTASGHYDSGSNTFTAAQIAVLLND